MTLYEHHSRYDIARVQPKFRFRFQFRSVSIKNQGFDKKFSVGKSKLYKLSVQCSSEHLKNCPILIY